MMYLHRLSSDEQRAIKELQMLIQEDVPSEISENIATLYRFLKARNFNVDKAEHMIRKHLLFRKSYDMDNILKDFKPEEFYLKYVEPSRIGSSKEGDVVLYSPAGKIYGKDIQKCSKMNDYLRHWIWWAENIRSSIMQLEKKSNGWIPQIIMIVNLDELSFGNTTCKYSTEQCMRLMHLIMDNLPEYVKSTYIINAPGYFVLLFSILKKIMSSEMIQKVHIFCHDGWKEKLLEVMDADVLPAFLGGNQTDPDGNPLCKTFVSHGGRIPEIYHIPDESRWFKDMKQVKKIQVCPRKKEHIPIEVTKSKSVIQWEFLIKGSKDMGFGLLFEEEENGVVEELLPLQKYDTIDGTEIGSYKARHNGIYIIVFDNSHSWITSKEVEYCITVT